MPSPIRTRFNDSFLQRRGARTASWRGRIRPAYLLFGVLGIGLVLAGCSSGSAQPSASSTSSSSATTAHSSSAAPSSTTPTTAAAAAATTSGTPTCPTAAQVSTALSATYTGPVSRPAPSNAIVCEYTEAAGGNAGVTIFAHQNSAVFAGQVAEAAGKPAMPAISGVGDGGFGSDIGGRSIVNAYSNGSRTLVAAQGPGSLSAVETLARDALADN